MTPLQGRPPDRPDPPTEGENDIDRAEREAMLALAPEPDVERRWLEQVAEDNPAMLERDAQQKRQRAEFAGGAWWGDVEHPAPPTTPATVQRPQRTRTTATRRPRCRSTHSTRPGHRRTRTAQTGASSDDDGSGCSEPALAPGSTGAAL